MKHAKQESDYRVDHLQDMPELTESAAAMPRITPTTVTVHSFCCSLLLLLLLLLLYIVAVVVAIAVAVGMHHTSSAVSAPVPSAGACLM